MSNVHTDTRAHSDARLFWPSPNPRMTSDELAAWLPRAIAAATAEATDRWRARGVDEVARIRRAIAELEAKLAETEATYAGPPPFVEVECPCCRGAFLVEPIDDRDVSIAEHLAGSDGVCDRELWGHTQGLRECLRVNDLSGDEPFLVIP
jgi:hypothetical protein